jgi:hypothetical protein
VYICVRISISQKYTLSEKLYNFNNPVANTIFIIMRLVPRGCSGFKSFGFLSCYRCFKTRILKKYDLKMIYSDKNLRRVLRKPATYFKFTETCIHGRHVSTFE